jgi:hypothetical protein
VRRTDAIERNHANGGTIPIIPLEESGGNTADSEETTSGGYNEKTYLNEQMEAGRKRTTRI